MRLLIRVSAVAATASLALGWAVPRTASAQRVDHGTSVTQPTATPIPVPQVAQRAEEVAALLRQSAERLAADMSVSDVDSRLPGASEWITDRLAATMQILDSSPSSIALATLTDSWMVMRSQLAGWSDVLARRATQLERELSQLEAIRATWSASHDEALASRTPPSVLERINATLDAVAAARSTIVDNRARVLGLQDRVVREMARCDVALGKIAQAQAALAGPLLVRDTLPIWSGEAPPMASMDLTARLRQAVNDNLDLTRQYLASQATRILLQLALFVIVLLLARRGRGEAHAAATALDLPFSSALVLALLATGWIYPQPPRAITNLGGLLVLVPAVLIVVRLADARVVPAVGALAAYFLVDRVRELCAGAALLEQRVFLVEMLVGIVFLALALRSQRVATEGAHPASGGWRQAAVWALWAQLVIVVGAVIAGALGFMQLARRLGTNVLISSYAALVLYAGVRVGEGLIASLLRSRLVRNVFMVQRHRELLQRRFQGALYWIAAGTWTYLTLGGFGVMEPLGSAVVTALNTRYVRGAVSLSVGDVLAFALTVWATFLVSSVVRFVLEEDVYPRLGLSRGLPYAVSTLIHYAVVFAGFLLGLAALGFDLTRITILAGAFGVGVGIGLQNVVANFVAGLILLLERRIHVGDSIATGDLQGEVRDIGFRASTIRTYDGADVIVPNGRLTSERVTNWTLADCPHRVDVKVPIVHAADPARVLGVLRDTGRAYAGALPKPAPEALCTGFSDNGVNFELRVWIDSLADSEHARSDLAMASHAALTAAGIDLALFPADIAGRLLNRSEDGDRRH